MTIVINVDNHAILYYTIYGRDTIIYVHSQQMGLKTWKTVIVII